MIPALLPLASPEGAELLATCGRSQLKALNLLAHGEPQCHLHACGVASAVTVLNAAPIERPFSSRHSPCRYFTQTDFFSDAVAAIKPADGVKRNGMTLEELGRMLTAHGLRVERLHAEDDARREMLTAAGAHLEANGRFVIANFLGADLYGDDGYGHFSPIGAWHAGADRWLILDVARYCHNPVWVTGDALWHAMATTDSMAGRRRGLLLLSA